MYMPNSCRPLTFVWWGQPMAHHLKLTKQQETFKTFFPQLLVLFQLVSLKKIFYLSQNIKIYISKTVVLIFVKGCNFCVKIAVLQTKEKIYILITLIKPEFKIHFSFSWKNWNQLKQTPFLKWLIQKQHCTKWTNNNSTLEANF